MRVAGLGARALVVVDPTPGTVAMSPDALATALRADVAAGLRPVLVCPTIGTTGTGAVDPVRAVATTAHEHGAWVHVDAAWAGVAALCPEYRHLLDGVELVDSFCTDAHKWLLTAFDASLLWVRDATALPDALSITPEYLRNTATDSGAVVDYRDWQVSLGRRFRALKLWAVLHTHGLDGLRTHIRGHIALAAELADRVRAEPGFTLAAPPSLALVCLRVRHRRPRHRRPRHPRTARGRQRLRTGVPQPHRRRRPLHDPGRHRRRHHHPRTRRRAVGPAPLHRSHTGNRARTKVVTWVPARLPVCGRSGQTPTRSSALSAASSTCGAAISSVRSSCALSARVAS